MTTFALQSPIHELLKEHRAVWARTGESVIAAHFGKPEAERQALRTLALCDVSALPKVGLKGSRAAEWLKANGVTTPPNRYDTAAWEKDGLILRTDANEFVLEGAPGSQTVSHLIQQWRMAPNADPLLVERSDASFVLAGNRSNDVLRQTCGVNFADSAAAPLNRLVMTRVAGVSCVVLPQGGTESPRFRLWLDPSFAEALWESLLPILKDLHGHIIGAAAIYPTWQPK